MQKERIGSKSITGQKESNAQKTKSGRGMNHYKWQRREQKDSKQSKKEDNWDHSANSGAKKSK